MVKLVFAILGITISLLGLLVWQASIGNDTVKIILAALVIMAMIYTSQLVMIVQTYLRDKREQQNFMNNVRENMQIMETMQRTQDAQNQRLLRQARDMAKLPSGDEVFDVTDYVDLDNLEIEGL